MGLLEDVMKTLERIPAWKRLNALPAEVEALQKRVEALEAKLGPRTGKECPQCGDMAMKLIASKPHPQFAFAGAKRDTLKCESCGFQEDQDRGLK